MSSTRRDDAFTLYTVGDEREFVRRVGQRIRRAREQRGWTQLQLANRMTGEHYSSQVSAWETGRRMPSTANLLALADALDVDVEAFFRD